MSFFEELKRRNVVRVGIAYAVIGWVLAQIAELAFDSFGAPDWVMKSVLFVLLLGLPLALFFAWAFEITPEGVKREKDVDRSQSITKHTGRKLDFIIIGVLVVAVGFLLIDRFSAEGSKPEVDEVVETESQRIAVLPFVNMSDDSDHFSDGLSEELLNLLAKIPDLRVTGRTSSFEFKGRNDDLREIGEALGVDHVLEGSVRRSGDRLRITAQLIKVDDGFHVWSETYDREMADIFDIQDDVASAITSALKVQLVAEEVRPTVNPDAYALYLEALPLLSPLNGDYRPAIEILDRAIALDPMFAKAYEAKAIAYWDVAAWTLSASDAQSLIYEAAGRAVELDPALLIARTFHGTAHPRTWSWISEIRALDEAVQIAPGNSALIGVLTYDLLNAGYFEEALGLANRQIEVDPLNFNGHMNKAKAYIALGRFESAEPSLNRMAALGGEQVRFDFKLGVYLIGGNVEAAIDLAESNPQIAGPGMSDFRSFVDNALHPDTGLEFLREQVDLMLDSATNFLEATQPYFWYLFFGYLDEYFDAIEKLDPPGSGTWSNAENLEHFGIVNRHSGFASHPRYLEYQEKYSMTELWDERGAPDFCNKDSGEWVCE
ncbi:MAG: tetratricopeptide repeat protein [Boseongicola sp.]